MTRHLKDEFVQRAQRDGYASRAAYKLEEICAKVPGGLLGPRALVFDLGAAPGGWTQVACARTQSTEADPKVFAIDLLPMAATPPGARFVQGDFTDAGNQEALLDVLRQRLGLGFFGGSSSSSSLSSSSSSSSSSRSGEGAGWGLSGERNKEETASNSERGGSGAVAGGRDGRRRGGESGGGGEAGAGLKVPPTPVRTAWRGSQSIGSGSGGSAAATTAPSPSPRATRPPQGGRPTRVCVLSDMRQNTSGNKGLDSARQADLCDHVLAFTTRVAATVREYSSRGSSSSSSSSSSSNNNNDTSDTSDTSSDTSGTSSSSDSRSTTAKSDDASAPQRQLITNPRQHQQARSRSRVEVALVMKATMGEDFEDLRRRVAEALPGGSPVKLVKPKSSRPSSPEVFMVAISAAA
jgi:23S rRNA U2552 (ribose-2'-O)-methylase RlmE/FtsJ